MRFWQVFEGYRSTPTKVFGQTVPNWKTDFRDAEDGLKLHLDGPNNYALVYINFVGTLMCEIDNKGQFSVRTPAELEDKLRDLGIIRYAGYDDTH